MRHLGAKPWIAHWILLAGLVAAAGCAEDKSGTPGTGDPFLQVRVNSSCDQNTLPVTTPAELQDKTMERAQVVVTGGDPTRVSGELASGTSIFIYVGKDGKPGGTGGSFMSTLGEDSLTGEPTTADQAFAPPALTDEFFCTKVGVHMLYAGVKKYTPTGSAIIMPVGDGFPVRCMEHEKWMCDCNEQCGPQDALVPDAMLPDAALPDAMLPDAVLPDGEIIKDMVVPPPTWQITFAEPQDPAALLLRIRAVAVPGQPSNVPLSFRVTDSGVPKPGIRVDFDMVQPGIRDVVLQPLFGISDAEGIVRTLVQAGNTPGQITVAATAHFPVPGSEELLDGVENSPPVTISSGLPSLTEFNFACHDPVIAAIAGRTLDVDLAPPDGDRWLLGITPGTDCFVTLADRLKNRIPAGTQVRFTTEAGSVNAVAATDMDGGAKTTLLVTVPHPRDTVPQAYEGGEFIHPSEDGPLVYNPRDGLVRLVASTRGEEGFQDMDGDKGYTDGVDVLGPTDDVGEPFVDANDNNAFDEGEEFDDVDNSGFYEPANGLWDQNTVIWRSTTLLWHGAYVENASYFGSVRCDPATEGCSAEGLFGNATLAGTGGCRNEAAEIYFSATRSTPVESRPVDMNRNCLGSREAGTITIEARSFDDTYGAPRFVESNSSSWDHQLNKCFDRGVPERPVGGSYLANLLVQMPPEDDEEAPDHVVGLLSITMSYQRADLATEVVTTFRTYCADFAP